MAATRQSEAAPGPAPAPRPAIPEGQMGGTISDVLAPPPTLEQALVEQRRNAELAAHALEQDRLLRQQAETLGYDLDTWRVIVSRSPEMAAEMVAVKAKALADTRRAELDAGSGIGQEVDLAGLSALLSGGDDAGMNLLVSEDQRLTHTRLYDPPRADGKVYGTSLFPNDQVRGALARGFSVVPRGALAPKPGFACDMNAFDGTPCQKKLRTVEDLEAHKQAKHRTAYAARERARAEAYQQQQIDLQREQLDLMRRQFAAAGGGGGET